MARTGRKPLAAGHVDRLQGSPYARQRLRLLLECLREEKTIPEACLELGLCEARFHTLRHHWLQGSLELLEPRRSGRRCKEPSRDELQQRVARLERENQQLTQQLREARVQLEVAQIVAAPLEPPKKTAGPLPR
jgi:serine phosphatase RsbU (regulator of sigma subunit)